METTKHSVDKLAEFIWKNGRCDFCPVFDSEECDHVGYLDRDECIRDIKLWAGFEDEPMYPTRDELLQENISLERRVSELEDCIDKIQDVIPVDLDEIAGV